MELSVIQLMVVVNAQKDGKVMIVQNEYAQNIYMENNVVKLVNVK